jgi:aryl-alcohol dehydrogenase-like predicted oxidoreductase
MAGLPATRPDTGQMTETFLEPGRAGLGTAPFGSGPDWWVDWGPADSQGSVASVSAALAAGVGWIDTAPFYGWGRAELVVGPVAVAQHQFSLLHRAPEHDGVLDWCAEHGVAFLAWAPLASGFLADHFDLEALGSPGRPLTPPCPLAGCGAESARGWGSRDDRSICRSARRSGSRRTGCRSR